MASRRLARDMLYARFMIAPTVVAPARISTRAPDDDAPIVLTTTTEAPDARVTSVVGEHYDFLRNTAARMLRESHAAEDLAHDVYLELPAALNRFRREASFRTFLVGITINQARRHRRRTARHRAAIARLAAEPIECRASPEDDSWRHELAAVLIEAWTKLPPIQRDAFWLYSVEGHSAAEVASRLGIPEATVRTRVFHARKHLRRLLAPVFVGRASFSKRELPLPSAA